MKILSYIILIFVTAVLFFMWSQASATPKVSLNPLYIPRIQVCSDYSKLCGKEFKRILALYDYRVCKVVENEACVEWYDPVELHYVFQTLTGWHD